MKKELFFLFCIGLLNSIFAYDFNNVYSGEFFCSKGVIPTYLFLKNDIYTI